MNKKAQIMPVLSLTEKERSEKGLPIMTAELAKYFDVTPGLITRYRLEVPRYLKEQTEKKRERDRLERGDEEEKVESEVNNLLDHLYEEAMKPNATAGKMELYLKARGRLVEKREDRIVVELSADEIARRNLRAERELRESGYRVEEMQEELLILPKNVRKD